MIHRRPLNIFAISGSLKSSSISTSLLRELPAFLERTDACHIYDGLEALPPFNPDKETGNDAVARFKQQLKNSDGIVISTPEYAFGLPGALKNALDWTVHSGELNAKPVAVISASPLATGGDKAMASLLLTLSALGTITPPGLVLSIPEVLKKMNADQQLTDEPTRTALKNITGTLIKMIVRVDDLDNAV